jgi:putative PIN family toxin of toxin-antitoxin system
MIRERSHLQLYSSAILLEELTDVLTRPAATKRLALIGKTHREVLSAYLEVIELAEPTETPRVVRDPDDDHVIATALAARASLPSQRFELAGERVLVGFECTHQVVRVEPAGQLQHAADVRETGLQRLVLRLGLARQEQHALVHDRLQDSGERRVGEDQLDFDLWVFHLRSPVDEGFGEPRPSST